MKSNENVFEGAPIPISITVHQFSKLLYICKCQCESVSHLKVDEKRDQSCEETEVVVQKEKEEEEARAWTTLLLLLLFLIQHPAISSTLTFFVDSCWRTQLWHIHAGDGSGSTAKSQPFITISPLYGRTCLWDSSPSNSYSYNTRKRKIKWSIWTCS